MLRFVTDERNSTGRLNRREWLRIGGLGGLGLLSPWGSLRKSRADEASSRPSIPGFGKAKSVIIVFASGGQSQIDTWDPKPEAPSKIRGKFETIGSSVPGTFLCEHMPQIARLADKYTIVRSMSHEDLDHGSAFYLSMTGHYHNRRSSNPLPSPNDHPTYGSILKRVRPTDRFVQTSVHVNGPALVPEIVGPGQFGGFLGREYDPMLVGDVTKGELVIPGLSRQDELPPVRMEARKSLLKSLEGYCRDLEHNREMLDMSDLYRQAFRMLADPQSREAFNLSVEPEELRNRYGRHRSGQACLLARRLVEAGAPLVTVIWNHTNRGQDKKPGQTDFYGWDTHNDIFQALEKHLMPRFDESFSALLEDLDDRGMLEDTLVVCMGEFGRAPLVKLEPRFAGSTPGRKHWSSVYSIALAGAGVQRGKIVGRSDRRGAYPTTTKYGPWDVAATIFSALGIDPSGHYTDLSDRPFPIATGRPIEAVYTG